MSEVNFSLAETLCCLQIRARIPRIQFLRYGPVLLDSPLRIGYGYGSKIAAICSKGVRTDAHTLNSMAAYIANIMGPD